MTHEISLSPEMREKIQKRLLEWGKKCFANFSWRRTANKFHALMAEVFLQRTRAEQVESVYREFCSRYKKPEDLVGAPSEEVQKLLKPLGLHWRISFIQQLATELSGRSQISEDLDDLKSLPALGPYSAAAFLSFHCNRRHPIVDNNVVRLYGRLFGFEVDGETRRKKWFRQLAEQLTPISRFRDYNYALIDFTRRICKPSPSCHICPLNDLCVFGASVLKADSPGGGTPK